MLMIGINSEGTVFQERQLYKQYAALRAVEESFLEQKARVKWLSLEDSNTGYFHQMVKVRRAKNTLKSLSAIYGGTKVVHSPGNSTGGNRFLH